MNIFCNSSGEIFHVIPERIFQGSAGVNRIYFIGQFPSSAQVLMSYTLPNGLQTSPKMLALNSKLEEVQAPNGGKFAVWEGRIGASPKVENGQVVTDENGNIVYDLDYTITENYGTATIQFFVYGASNGVTDSVGVLATASTNFIIEKGVPVLLPLSFDEEGDVQQILAQILNILANTQTLYDNVDKALYGEEGTAESPTQNSIAGRLETLEGNVSELSENDADQSTRLETVEGKTEANANSISTAESNIAALQETTSKDLGAVLSIDYDNSAYKLTIKLLNKEGATLGEAFEIDLPLESVVVKGEYLPTTKTLVLTLQNGNIINIPLGDIIDGLIPSSAKGQPNGVASLDENGKVPTEQLPEGIGGGGSLPEGFNPEDYVKFTDIANGTKAGVIKYEGSQYGIYLTDDGVIKTEPATEAEILEKANVYKPITPRRLPYAVKVGITTNTETLTDEEKASACDWLGAVKKVTTLTTYEQAYVKSGDGTKTKLLDIDNSNTANNQYIVKRDAYGAIYIPDNAIGRNNYNFAAGQEAVNKNYVDDKFLAKKTGITGEVIITQKPDGTTDNLAYTTEIANLHMVRRTINGDVLVPDTPTSSQGAVNRNYVANEIAAVKDNNVTARIFIHDEADYPSYTFLINVPKAFYEFYYMVPYELAIEYLKRVGATGWETAVLCTGFFNLAGGRVYYEEGAGCIRVGTSPDQASAEEYSEVSLQLIDFYTE